MNMAVYVLRRAVIAIGLVLCVMTITFVLSHNIGGNPVEAWLGRTAGAYPELAKAFAAEYHLNDPVYVQYYYYLLNLAQGNLGLSPSRGFVPVSQVIAETLPFTLQIAFFSTLFTLVLGIGFGLVSARYHDTPVDGAIQAFYLVGYGSPAFFIALIFLIVFSYWLGVLPGSGAADPNIVTPYLITGLPMIDSVLEGNFAYFYSAVLHLILPCASLVVINYGVVTRLLRSTLLDIMHANYIRTARAKGLTQNIVFYKHGLRHALIPIVSLSSVVVTWIITGTIFVENIFSYPGLGSYVVQALNGLDYPGILGATIVYAIIIIAANLVADILYAVVDPQVRLG